MSERKKTGISVSPWTVVLLVLFAVLASPASLAALLLAALCHELGHYFLLTQFGAAVTLVRISVFGAEMQVAQKDNLSYPQEIAATAAGPAVNLLLSPLFSAAGACGELWYLLSGAQLLIGLYNLLPIRSLDGGMLLWLLVAWRKDPFAADRWVQWAGSLFCAAILLLGSWLWVKCGSPFLLLGALGLSHGQWSEKRLVKRRKNR